MNNLSSNSEVLDRVKRFLPLMKTANEELESRIRSDGNHSVIIDQHLKSQLPAQETLNPNDKAVGDVSTTTEVLQDDDVESSDEDVDEVEGQQAIEVEFAIGDFDNSILAQIEKEDEKCSE